jgi:AcrR family transcriptional regulator
MSTKEVIISKAIEMFNQNGLEYFGIRELAKECKMKAGNITYYFPTKNHLIAEIANRCTESSNGILNFQEGMNCYDFLEMIHHLFQNQYQYRNLMLSLPHIVREIEEINVHYKEAQIGRKESFDKVLHLLHTSGSLEKPSEALNLHFVDLLLMVIRFWISDYAVNESIGFNQNQPFHHIDFISNFLNLYATDKGKEEMKKFKSEIQRYRGFDVPK